MAPARGPPERGTVRPQGSRQLGSSCARSDRTLQPDGTAESFAANSGALTSQARQDGLLASDWQLSARTDGLGRLTTLAFSGRSWGQPFALDLVILLDLVVLYA